MSSDLRTLADQYKEAVEAVTDLDDQIHGLNMEVGGLIAAREEAVRALNRARYLLCEEAEK